MRHSTLAALVVGGTVALSSQAQAASLVGWYRFNDAGNLGLDSSGKHNNGTIYNDGLPPVFSSATSVEGAGSAYFNGTFNQQASNFEGGGGRIDVPINTGPVAMPEMSWGAWVRPDLVDHGRYVLSSDTYNGGRTIGVDNRANDNFASILGNQSPWVYNTGVAATPGSWVFIGAVYRNDPNSPGTGTVTLYVGNQVFSDIVTHYNTNSPSYTSIGGDAARERYWSGYIDEAFIFNGALSRSQMTFISNNPGTSLAAIPEPSSYGALIGCLGLALAVGRRGKRNRA